MMFRRGLLRLLSVLVMAALGFGVGLWLTGKWPGAEVSVPSETVIVTDPEIPGPETPSPERPNLDASDPAVTGESDPEAEVPAPEVVNSETTDPGAETPERQPPAEPNTPEATPAEPAPTEPAPTEPSIFDTPILDSPSSTSDAAPAEDNALENSGVVSPPFAPVEPPAADPEVVPTEETPGTSTPLQPLTAPTSPPDALTATQAATLSGARRSGAQPLDSLNRIRALAALPPVSRNAAWEAQCVAHARYMALADRGEHREDPNSPYRSVPGEACAHGHYFVSSQPDSAPDRAITYWASGPFHLPQLLDPRLKTAAFALTYDRVGTVQSAAVLDVRRGLSGTARYPVKFPAPGQTSPLLTAASAEWPDPLPSCAGYAHPVGAPIALLLGPGSKFKAAALKVNGRPVAACLLTAETFRGASAGDTTVGRNVLASQGAAILLPRLPLVAGATVKVSFRSGAGSSSWQFKVK